MLPDELTDLRQWLMWNYGIRHGKQTKVPYRTNHWQASTTDPKHWNTYASCSHALVHGKNFSGIGFVFTPHDPYCGIDLDHCIENGLIAQWALSIVWKFASYAELSASRTGIHIILKGQLPEGKGKRSGQIEVYDRGRYFTMTGQPLDGYDTIKDCQPQLAAWYSEMWPIQEAVAPSPSVAVINSHLSNADIWRIAFNARNAAKIADLYSGTWQPHYKTQSEADMAFLTMLAFYAPDKTQLRSLFEESGLYRKKPNGMRAKYNDNWYNKMLDWATANVTHTYNTQYKG